MFSAIKTTYSVAVLTITGIQAARGWYMLGKEIKKQINARKTEETN